MTVEIMPGMIAVEVPEGQSYFDIYGNQWEQELCWNEMPKRGKFKQVRIPLPEGNWTFLFCTADASEEQCAGIVGEPKKVNLSIDEYIIAFPSFDKTYECYLTAKESLQSLLSSNGLNNCAVLKKIN